REVEALVSEKLLGGPVPAGPGEELRKGVAPRRPGVRRRGDLDVGPRQPSGQVPVDGDVARAEDRPAHHGNTAPIASSRTSRPSSAVASSVFNGGLIRMIGV